MSAPARHEAAVDVENMTRDELCAGEPGDGVRDFLALTDAVEQSQARQPVDAVCRV
jgi:hypothetical protein